MASGREICMRGFIGKSSALVPAVLIDKGDVVTTIEIDQPKEVAWHTK